MAAAAGARPAALGLPRTKAELEAMRMAGNTPGEAVIVAARTGAR
jgi:hypothetical protein